MAMTYDREGYINLMTTVFQDEIRKEFNDPTLDSVTPSLQAYLFSAIGEGLAQATSYAEYLARETKWDLAVNESSIMSEIAFRGYMPKKPQSARGNVLVSVSTEDGTTNPYGVNFSESATWSPTLLYDAGSMIIYNIAGEGEAPNYRLYEANTAILTYSLPPNGTGASYWDEQTPPSHEAIILPKWFTFSSEEGFTYCTYNETTLVTDVGYASVPVIQGIPTKFTYTATGADFETLDILDSNFENTLYEVYVNGGLFTKIDSIYNADVEELVYEVRPTYDKNTVQFRFGNNFFGKRLNTLDLIEVYYIKTAGISGNVSTRRGVSVVAIPNQPDNSGTIFKLSVTNIDKISGAASGDTLDNIREFAVTSFQTQQRCVTYDDYKRLLLDYPLIEKVLIWGAYEYLRDNNLDLEYYIPETENRIYVTAITTSGENLTTSEKENILLYLLPYKSPTDLIKFEDAHLINIVFNVRAYIRDRSQDLTSIAGQIQNHLVSEYSVTNMDFNEAVYETVWKGGIHTAAPSIVYHESYTELEESYDFVDGIGEAFMAKSIELGFDSIEDKNTLNKVTTFIYFRKSSSDSWVQIGKADSTTVTNLVGVDGYTSLFEGGQNYIAYETGTVSIVLIKSEVDSIFFDSDATDLILEQCEIKIRYQLENEFDIIPSGRNQLLSVSSVNVSTAYLG